VQVRRCWPRRAASWRRFEREDFSWLRFPCLLSGDPLNVRQLPRLVEQRLFGTAGVPAILNGFKGEVDAVGPGLTYTTQIGKIPFIFNARHYEEFNVKSRFDNSVTIITGTFVF
jgi:hypothetical protein